MECSPSVTCDHQSDSEILLIERVLLRFAAVETDVQLQTVIDKFLAPSLLKLGSDHPGVRTKIMELFVHVNKRLKSCASVQLPVQQLIQLYENGTSSAFVRNFAFVYIKMGFQRMPAAHRGNIALSLLLALQEGPRAHTNSLLTSIVTALAESSTSRSADASGAVPSAINSSTADLVKSDAATCSAAEHWQKLLDERPAVRQLLIQHIEDVFLFPYGWTWPPVSSPTSDGGGELKAPPGLSVAAVRRILGASGASSPCNAPPSAADLEHLKCGLLRWLEKSECMPAQLLLPAVIVATSDTRFSVATPGATYLARISESIDWSDSGLVRRLCAMFLGTCAVVKSSTAASDTPGSAVSDERRQPVSVRLRLKMLPLLTQRCSAHLAPSEIIQIVAVSLFGDGVTVKLRTLAMLLAACVSPSAAPATATFLLGCARRVLREKPPSNAGVSSTETWRLRSAAFTVIEKVIDNNPALLGKDLTLLAELISLMSDAAAGFGDSDSGDLDSAHSAVVSVARVARAVCINASDLQNSMEHMLVDAGRVKTNHTDDESIEHLPSLSVRVRRTLVLCWSLVFPENHARSRLHLLAAAADSDQLVAETARSQLGFDASTVATSGRQFQLAEFAEMLECVCERSKKVPVSKDNTVYSWPRFPLQPVSLDLAVRYLSACLRSTLIKKPNSSSSISAEDEQFVMDEQIVGRSSCALSEILSDCSADSERVYYTDSLIATFVELCRQTVKSHSSSAGSLFCLLEIVASLPSERLRRLIECPSNSMEISGVAVNGLLSLDWLEHLVTSPAIGASGDMWRQYSAELYGLVFGATAFSAAEKNSIIDLEQALNRLAQQACDDKTSNDIQQTCVLAIAHAIASWVRLVSEGNIGACVDAVEKLSSATSESFVRLASHHVLASGGAMKCPLLDTGCEFVAIVCASGAVLPFLSSVITDTKTLSEHLAERFSAIIADDSRAIRTRELATVAASMLCVSTSVQTGSWRRKLCEQLLATAPQLDQFELQLAVGDTLVSAVLGAESPLVSQRWRKSPTAIAVQDSNMVETADNKMDCASDSVNAAHVRNSGEELFDWLLNQLTNGGQDLPETVRSKLDSPRARLSSCLWVLLLVKHCSKCLQPSHFPDIQRWLILQLTERSDVLQETAGRSLMFLHDAAPITLRSELLQSLVTSITGRQLTVPGDQTQSLHGEQSRSTAGISAAASGRLVLHRQICALVELVAQPELLYPFLAMAQDNAVWSTRRGSAIGLPSIARISAVVDGHKPNIYDRTDIMNKLIPKLYRFQFDPVPAVQRTMRAIWRALITSSVASNQSTSVAMVRPVLQHACAICVSLTAELTDGQWRVRQSCATAVNELLSTVGAGVDAAPLLPQLAPLWLQLARVCDDIKESVRSAALTALRQLSGIFVRLCQYSANEWLAERAMTQGLPTLLVLAVGCERDNREDASQLPEQQGMITASDCCAEARSICLEALAQLVEKLPPAAAQKLNLQLPQLVEQLLVQLSELEPKQLRYLSVRLAGDGSDSSERQQILDRARLAAIKESVLYRTLMHCARRVDSLHLLDLLSARLAAVLRRNSGLAAKCGAALFIGRLCCEPLAHLTSYGEENKTNVSSGAGGFSGVLLSALLHGVRDRNAIVASTCASVCGVFCRWQAPLSSTAGSVTRRLLRRVCNWYIETLLGSADASTDSDISHRVRVLCAEVMVTVARDAPDQLRDHKIDAVAVTFVAMHEADWSQKSPRASSGRDSQDSTWRDVWLELTGSGGASAVLHLHMDDIMQLCGRLLAAQSWSARAQAARTVAGVVRGIECQSTAAAAAVSAAINILLPAVGGRVWIGKEHVLTAIAEVCKLSEFEMIERREEVADALVCEVSKGVGGGVNKFAYRTVAVRTCGDVLQSTGVDRFERLFCAIRDRLPLDVAHNEGSSSDEDNGDNADRQRTELQLATVLALGRSWPLTADTQLRLSGQYLGDLKKSWPQASRNCQKMIVTALSIVVPRICWLPVAPGSNLQYSPVSPDILLEWLCHLVWLLSRAVGLHEAHSTISEALDTTAALVSRLCEGCRSQKTEGNANYVPAAQVVNMLGPMLRPVLAEGNLPQRYQPTATEIIQHLDELCASL